MNSKGFSPIQLHHLLREYSMEKSHGQLVGQSSLLVSRILERKCQTIQSTHMKDGGWLSWECLTLTRTSERSTGWVLGDEIAADRLGEDPCLFSQHAKIHFQKMLTGTWLLACLLPSLKGKYKISPINFQKLTLTRLFSPQGQFSMLTIKGSRRNQINPKDFLSKTLVKQTKGIEMNFFL